LFHFLQKGGITKYYINITDILDNYGFQLFSLGHLEHPNPQMKKSKRDLIYWQLLFSSISRANIRQPQPQLWWKLYMMSLIIILEVEEDPAQNLVALC